MPYGIKYIINNDILTIKVNVSLYFFREEFYKLLNSYLQEPTITKEPFQKALARTCQGPLQPSW